jgi:hypothetical protein
MVGVVHRDPNGYKQLYSLLGRIRPQAITVEISPIAVIFRKEQGPRLLAELQENLKQMANELACPVEDIEKNSHIIEIQEQIKLPFEYQAAINYGRAFHIKVSPVDVSWYSRLKLSQFESLISQSNVKSLLKLCPYSLEEKIRKEYFRADAAFRHIGGSPLNTCPSVDRQEWQIREDCMARRIRRAIDFVEGRGGGVLVHVGGWMHLLEGHLYSLFNHVHPCRHLLSQQFTCHC